MPYCRNCGAEINEYALTCPKCGAQQRSESSPAPSDEGGFLWGLLGCCIPIAGLILFLVWKDTLPLRSKSCGKGALVGVILYVIFIIISVAIGACAAASAYDYYAAVLL